MGPADANGVEDVYVYDRTLKRTVQLASAYTWIDYWGVCAGQETITEVGNGPSLRPSIAKDGRYVAFESSATNLVSGDTNATKDVFVRDRLDSGPRRASVSTEGSQANGSSSQPSISSDGRYVSFSSLASNLTTKDPNGAADTDTNWMSDVFRRDRTAAVTIRVSAPCACWGEPNGQSSRPSISADGQLVAFETRSTNQYSCGGCDTNGVIDIVQYLQGDTALAKLSVDDRRPQANGPSATPSVSGDGTYAAFSTDATTVFSEDANGVSDIALHTWVSSLPAEGSSALDATAPAETGSCSTGEGGAPGELSTAQTSGYCVVSRESEENEENRKQAARVLRNLAREIAQELAQDLASANREKIVRDCGDPVYHYTDAATAKAVFDSGQIRARAAYTAGGVSYKAGAYATTIWPSQSGWTQPSLRVHLAIPDASHWVMLCRDRDGFREHGQGAPADIHYLPGPAGQALSVRPVAWGNTGAAVPDCRDQQGFELTYEDCEARLRAAGFATVTRQDLPDDDERYIANGAISTSPAAGSYARTDQPVVVTTNPRRRACDRSDPLNRSDGDPNAPGQMAFDLYTGPRGSGNPLFPTAAPPNKPLLITTHLRWGPESQRKSAKAGFWSGFGYRHIAAKHGWSVQDEQETRLVLTNPSGPPILEDATLERYRYVGPTYTGRGGVDCERRVVVQYLAKLASDPDAPGIITSFGAEK